MPDDSFYLLMGIHIGEDEESARYQSFQLLANNDYAILFYDENGNVLTPASMVDQGDPHSFGVTHTYFVVFAEYHRTVYIHFDVPLDKTVTVTVTGLGTITFTGNAFAKAMAKSSNPDRQQKLGAALYHYGAAPKACWVTGA